MVCECLSLRKGNYTKVTKEDMYLMCRIMQNKPPNLGELIVRRMLKAVAWSKKEGSRYGLPYGKIVSSLIYGYCTVPGYEIIDNTPTLQKLDETALPKMDFVRDANKGEWVKKESARAVTLDSLNAAMMRGFDRLNNEVARLHNRYDGMEAQMWEIRERLAAMEENEEAAADDGEDEMSP